MAKARFYNVEDGVGVGLGRGLNREDVKRHASVEEAVHASAVTNVVVEDLSSSRPTLMRTPGVTPGMSEKLGLRVPGVKRLPETSSTLPGTQNSACRPWRMMERQGRWPHLFRRRGRREGQAAARARSVPATPNIAQKRSRLMRPSLARADSRRSSTSRQGT